MPTAIWKSRLRSGSAHCDLEVAVEVRQCPLKSRLRSGSAHCDLEVAVEVRQCPLGSGARGGGPAVPTGIWTARRRRRVRRRRRQWRRRRRRRTALIKSNNPHLAGGKKYQIKPIIVAILSPDMGRLNLGNHPTWITHRLILGNPANHLRNPKDHSHLRARGGPRRSQTSLSSLG